MVQNECEHLGAGKTICNYHKECPFYQECLARRLLQRQQANSPWEKKGGATKDSR